MTQRAPRPCTYPGCGALVSKGRCARHTQKRQKTAARGYDQRWRRIRAQFLKAHPICECDDKCGQPATEVDHIVPYRISGTHAWSNLRAMTKSCHSKKTYAQDGSFGR